MSLENGKCLSCGAPMNLDASKEKMTCRYCMSEIIIPQAVQKFKIDGITTFDSLILAAEQAIKFDEDYDKALKKYRQALDLNPEDYRVYWGIFLCEIDSINWYKRTKGFVQFPGDVPNSIANAVRKWGSRAVMFAPQDLKIAYQNRLDEIESSLRNKPVETSKKGCYIATAVYGSYDCEEVWVLRRYRDNNLSATKFGRLFILVYYKLSPMVVKVFGKSKLFNRFFRSRLDKKVAKLIKTEAMTAPYEDK